MPTTCLQPIKAGFALVVLIADLWHIQKPTSLFLALFVILLKLEAVLVFHSEHVKGLLQVIEVERLHGLLWGSFTLFQTVVPVPLRGTFELCLDLSVSLSFVVLVLFHVLLNGAQAEASLLYRLWFIFFARIIERGVLGLV